MTNQIIDTYMDNSNIEIKENANITKSIQGLNTLLAKKATTEYYMCRVYDKDIKTAHMDGKIHIHDTDQLTVYCVGHDLKALLIEGFRGVKGKAEASPAKHFGTALGQICNFLYTLQGEASGAQAFSNFDTYLAPFIIKDELTYEQVKQHLQVFVFNMNVPTRVGFQTPFTNVTLDIDVPKYMEEEDCIVGSDYQICINGKYTTLKYKHCKDAMNIFNKAFLEVMTEGDAAGRPFTFPICTYNITNDFNWDSAITNLLMEATAKYGLPSFSNFINSDLDPSDVRSMCCRLRIDNKKINKSSQFGSAPLTGAIGVVTLNLPRLMYSTIQETCSSDLDVILDNYKLKLKKYMDLASRSLEKKRVVIENMMNIDMYPYLKFYMKDVKLRTGKYFNNHFSVIGELGMNEAILHLLGTELGTTKQTIDIAKEISTFIRDYTEELTIRTGNKYNFEATPAEGISYSLCCKDALVMKEKHIYSGTSENRYYTNSSHIPNNIKLNIVDLLNKQDCLQELFTGGTTLPLYLGERLEKDNIPALKQFIKFICENYKLPYFTITPTFSICSDHGYIKGSENVCPICKKETEVFSRVVGYLRPVSQWNNGKKQEFLDRKFVNI